MLPQVDTSFIEQAKFYVGFFLTEQQYIGYIFKSPAVVSIYSLPNVLCIPTSLYVSNFLLNTTNVSIPYTTNFDFTDILSGLQP